MKIDPTILGKHKQLYRASCIPMSIELVLKLLGKIKPDFADLQHGTQNANGPQLGGSSAKQHGG
jgi:hypothetical protein